MIEISGFVDLLLRIIGIASKNEVSFSLNKFCEQVTADDPFVELLATARERWIDWRTIGRAAGVLSYLVG